MILRGYATVAALGAALALADVIQRTVVVGLVRLRPDSRDTVLARWQKLMARMVTALARVLGGARFGPIPRVPAGPGVLVVMNHQSLLDIPLVVRAVEASYPVIVTRARYARGKPVISHMVRLYDYPLVGGEATGKGDLKALGEAVAAQDHPVVLFPEGHRTRDGEIGPFKRGGLQVILGARQWDVWVLVTDGHWQAARLADFLRSSAGIHCRVELAGRLTSPPPGTDPGPFIREVRECMQTTLDRMRAGEGGA